MNLNVLIVGVGGQGTLLASKVLGEYASLCGYDCKLSEVHGMAQRGGSVVTHVRISSDTVYSPIIDEGGADILLSFEMLESLRWIHYLKKGGTLLSNIQEIAPLSVISGATTYPKDILHKIKAMGITYEVLDALSVAIKCGNERVVSTVMVAWLAATIKLNKTKFLTAVKNCVPEKTLDANIKAVNHILKK